MGQQPVLQSWGWGEGLAGSSGAFARPWRLGRKQTKARRVLFCFFKGIQTIEFIYQFEFNQTRIMWQYVYNKHQAIYLFLDHE
jgi:hypothetical protein